MALTCVVVTSAFARERARLTWRDVLWGVENGLVAPGVATDLAASKVTDQDDATSALVQLAGLGRGDPSQTFVERLASVEPEQDEEEIRRKWLYLALAWLFEHRVDYDEPLRVVEHVHADFDYPELVSGFVAYMPTDEPSLGSREQNEQRLYEKWQRYLDGERARYMPSGADDGPTSATIEF